ncbi:SIS domain-containing protein [Pelagibacteraceae bacterium]|nr:SIS domain-containing protein [Pelagibacteraceae bacterium]
MHSDLKFIDSYLKGVSEISNKIDQKSILAIIKKLKNIRKNKGRLFFIGIGGSAANSSHAVNDFRKLCSIETYTPTDNVSEFSANINDSGWDSSFAKYLKISNINSKDAIFILSVGGGNKLKKISVNLIKSIEFAKSKKTSIISIVGRKDGFAVKNSDIALVVPSVNKDLITPYSESFQSVILHCIVSSPILQKHKTKW